MSKHTPGPWKVYLTLYRDGASQVGAKGAAICEVYADRDWSTVEGYPYAIQGRRDADARLIAAAPELLEALKVMLDVALFIEDLRPQEADLLGTPIGLARAAIAKAEDAS